MKLCVSSYSFGKYWSDLGPLDAIAKAAEMGFEGIELVNGDWTEKYTAEEIRNCAASHGLSIPSFCTEAELMFPKDGLKAEIARIKGRVDYAAALGAAVMRHDLSYGHEGEYSDEDFQRALPIVSAAAREIAEYAKERGIVTVSENHGFFLSDSTRIEKVYQTVNHPNYGIMIDIGNFMCADEAPNEAVRRLLPYVRHVHAKDFHYLPSDAADPGEGWFRTRGKNYLRGAIIGHGNANAAISLGMLANANYDGWISIEFEGMEDNLRGIALGRENALRYFKKSEK